MRGAGCYVGDLHVPGCLDAVFVRSHIGHGKVRAVDLEPARGMPGVVAAWSLDDLPFLPETPAMMNPEAVQGRPWPALATDRVRYVGEPLAIFVAGDRYVAEDARDATRVDIEPVPVLLDPTDTARSDVQLFPGKGNVAAQKDFGEPIDDSVWQDAAVVVKAGYRQQLLAHTYMEAKAILVQPEPDGGLTAWVSHQAPHRLRRDLAAGFGLRPEQVRVIVPDVGGAFGGRARRGPSTSRS